MGLSILQEFKEFAVKGNMIDIAVGVIVGAAFKDVIDVIVKQIFLPPLSMLTSGTNWGDQRWVLREAIVDSGQANAAEVAIGYGKLFESIIDFLIIGLTVFLVVKIMNTLKRKAQDPKDETVKTPKDIELLNRVTELLEKQNEILAANTKP